MKKTNFLLITISILLLVSCAESEKSIISKIEIEVQKNMNDPSSYERISYKIDTITNNEDFKHDLNLAKSSVDYFKFKTSTEINNHFNSEYRLLSYGNRDGENDAKIKTLLDNKLIQYDRIYSNKDSLDFILKLIDKNDIGYNNIIIWSFYNLLINENKKLDSLEKIQLKLPTSINHFRIKLKCRGKNLFNALGIFEVSGEYYPKEDLVKITSSESNFMNK